MKIVLSIFTVYFVYYIITSNLVPSYAIFLLICSLGLSVRIIGNAILELNPRPVLFCGSLYTIVGLLIPAISHSFTGVFPFFGFSYSSDTQDKGAQAIFLFLLFMWLGYKNELIFSGFIGHKKNFFDSLNKTYNEIYKKYQVIVFALTVVIILSIIISGDGAFSTSRGDSIGVDKISPVQAMSQACARSCSAIASILCLSLFIREKSLYNLFFMIVSSLAVAYTYNPASTARFITASIVLSFWFTFGSTKNIYRLLISLIIPIFGFILLPMLSNFSRGDAVGLSEGGLVSYWFYHGDFDGFQSILNVIELMDGRGYDYGRSILSVVLAAIPRGIWPGKSPGLGAEAAEFVGYPFYNISSPLVVEFMIDFGVLGLIIMSFLYGRWMRFMDELYVAARGVGLPHVAMGASFIAGYQFILFRGPLVGVVAPVMLTWIITIAIGVYIKKN